MKRLISFLAVLATAILPQNQVVAYFLAPSAGAAAAYKEGDFIGQAQSSLTVATEGKQIIVNAGNNKAQILAWDTGGDVAKTGIVPGWRAVTRAWLSVVDGTKDIDFDHSDLVYGNGETVDVSLVTTKVIPFKKEGNKILYDATLGGSTAVTSMNGLNKPPVTTTTPPPAPTPSPNPLGNKAGAGLFDSLPTWSWFLIVPLLVYGAYLLIKAVMPKRKTVKK